MTVDKVIAKNYLAYFFGPCTLYVYDVVDANYLCSKRQSSFVTSLIIYRQHTRLSRGIRVRKNFNNDDKNEKQLEIS